MKKYISIFLVVSSFLANCATMPKSGYPVAKENLNTVPTEEILESLDELAGCVGEISSEKIRKNLFLASYQKKDNLGEIKNLLNLCKTGAVQQFESEGATTDVEMSKRFTLYSERALDKDFRLGSWTSRQASCKYHNLSGNFAIYLGFAYAFGFTNCIDYSGRRWFGQGFSMGLTVGIGAHAGFTQIDDKVTSTLPFSPFSSNGIVAGSMWGAFGVGYFYKDATGYNEAITKGPVIGVGIGYDGFHWRMGGVIIPRFLLPKNREIHHEWLKVIYFLKRDLLISRVTKITGKIRIGKNPKSDIFVVINKSTLDPQTITDINTIIVNKDFIVHGSDTKETNVVRIEKIDKSSTAIEFVAKAKIQKGTVSPDSLAILDLTNTLPKESIEEKKKEILFKGNVFAVAGNSITISTTNAKSVRVGQEIIFLDSAGKEIGKGKITTTSFTNIKVSLTSGRAEKDRDAVIYKK
ncbi:MAG: hypothetical protein HUU45_11565 [Leptospiraceae bacterium]|nr:hypothetical protein [Leptospiraceae bacterium]